jgi:hypothetical protein
VHIEVQGNGVIKSLKFANGTLANIMERAVSKANMQINKS